MLTTKLVILILYSPNICAHNFQLDRNHKTFLTAAYNIGLDHEKTLTIKQNYENLNHRNLASSA